MATIKSPHREHAGNARETALALMRRTQGATLRELGSATGWQPHSLRAAISGLRKAGHAIVRTTRGGETCYTVASEA